MKSRVKEAIHVDRAHLSVALVGADGAGKSTVSRRLMHAGLPRPVKVIYMGVNLEASSLMLPTTRLLLAAKKARGGRSDLMGSVVREVQPGQPGNETDTSATVAVQRSASRSSMRAAARLSVWMLEEWLRQFVATWYLWRGDIVVFDRHFFADYFHADVRGGPAPRSRLQRFHGWMLEHVYPKPDLVILLDAPAERLHERKPEATVEWFERRRIQYLELATVIPEFVLLDADRPVDAVVADATELIRTAWKARA